MKTAECNPTVYLDNFAGKQLLQGMSADKIHQDRDGVIEKVGTYLSQDRPAWVQFLASNMVL